MNIEIDQQHLDYQRIAAAITWIAEHRQAQPSVTEMASAAGLSESHFSRLFRRWANISPQRYLAALTLSDARASLRSGNTVESAAWESGLSGAGRLHDLFVRIDAVSPGEFKHWGKGLQLHYGFANSLFGDALLVESERGIVSLSLGDEHEREHRLAAVSQQWPDATLSQSSIASAKIAGLFDPMQRARTDTVSVVLAGSEFQHKVWSALLDIASGETETYGELAARIGRPGASRAVGSAVGRNTAAVLIPCHRVLRAGGQTGGYRWGETRKRMALTWEQCQQIRA
ncbi:MAG: methylated-DNA--[protein]-cysteine S-methyltransferase [Woeseiaceae bacterium]